MEFVTGGVLKAPPHRGKLSQNKYHFVSRSLTLQIDQSRNLLRIKDSEWLHKLACQRVNFLIISMYASLDRLGVFYFVPFLPDVILSPIDHPSLRALGAEDLFKEYYALGGKPMTSRGLWPVTTY